MFARSQVAEAPKLSDAQTEMKEEVETKPSKPKKKEPSPPSISSSAESAEEVLLHKTLLGRGGSFLWWNIGVGLEWGESVFVLFLLNDSMSIFGEECRIGFLWASCGTFLI